jgi:2-(1,2-epoxy-1,2-dihydrophenyl)acetyl-CoA isomerase
MEPVLVRREDGVVTVSINRPEKKNAASWATWQALTDAARAVAADPTARVLVITGEGADFCSGADLWAGEEERPWLTNMRALADCCLAIQHVPQPTIAKVRGIAVGAGANLALACDLLVASDTSRFSEIFSKRGLSVDFGGSWFLPRRVGMHVAKELAFFADILPATEMERLGLVNRVVPDGELDAFVDGWAQRLAKAPPLAIMQTKRLLDNAMNMTLEQALIAEGAAQAANFATKDTAEALLAFSEKREPTFTGE